MQRCPRRRGSIRRFMVGVVLFVAATPCTLAQTTVLTANAPIEVPRAVGYFDYMLVDGGRRRVIAAHTESDSLAFVNADTSHLERQLYLGAAPHGLVIDNPDHVYLVGTSGAQHGVFVVDSANLKVIGFIHTPGPVDALAFDSKRHVLYADEDDGDSIWVVSVAARHIIDTIHTPRDSDKIEYDPTTDRVYQNFTTTNSTLIIDPVSHHALASISTLPARRPHGLAIDNTAYRLYAAGVNGRLVEIDLRSRAIVSTLDIAPHVDQIAIDVTRRRLYCASGEGYLSVVALGGARASVLANVPVPHGAHTVAVDRATGSVWISYGTERSDYLMKLGPARSIR